MAKLDRLNRRDAEERLTQHAGKRVRYVHVVLEMVDRKPTEIVMIQYSYLTFDTDGRLDAAEIEQEARLGIDMLHPFPVSGENSKVINAKHRFAKKQFKERYTWEPSEKVRSAIMNKVFGKHRG